MKATKILSLVLALILAIGALSLTSCSNGAKYTVGICQYDRHPALDAATQGFKDALTAALGEDVAFDEQNGAGSGDTCATIVGTFVTKKVDLIMANATPALVAARNATPDIPILGTSITEYGVALGLENFNGTVGGNISGTSDLAPLDQQAQMIIDLVPSAKTVGMLYCSAEPNSEYQVKKVSEYLTGKGITVKDFPFSGADDVQIVAANAADNCDALYIPTDNTAATYAEAIHGTIADKKVPVVAGEEGICGACGIATLSIDYYDLGYATGEMAAKILKGEADISTMAVEYTPEEKLAKKYNKEICESLGIDTAALEAKGFTAIEAAE
ncbi:MAG: ABC transporter substrate-binding protein [Clostridia bacterium]|nr:ABC transporter substrate-binding protein [Clostridia bacterium]